MSADGVKHICHLIFQFEEIWVSLLGVISISKDDLSDEEVKALSQCSSLVVQALTSIILQTTCLPKPGQANISRPIHHARDSPPQFLLSPRGQQLTSVQNLIQSNMERSSPLDQYLQVDCSLNLERCSGGSPDKYGLGQVGVSYIMSAVRHFGDEGFDSAETRSNKSTALSLPFLLREESLQATGN